jgi:hypothetical protein
VGLATIPGLLVSRKSFLKRSRNAVTAANCRDGRISFDVRAMLTIGRLLPRDEWEQECSIADN